VWVSSILLFVYRLVYASYCTMETGSSEDLALLAMEAFGRVGFSYGCDDVVLRVVSIVLRRGVKGAYLEGLDRAKKPPVCGHFNGGDDADVGFKDWSLRACN
jgi:hypothetical protein